MANNNFPSSNWDALDRGLLVKSTPIPHDRYAEEEANRIVWCNCASCAAVVKPPITCCGSREGRYLSSLAAKMEHGLPCCLALHRANRGHNYHFIKIASDAQCLVLQHKRSTPKGHSLCRECEDRAIECVSWEFDEEIDGDMEE